MVKRAPKAPRPSPEPAETSSELAASIYTESLTAIRDEIRGIVDGRVKPKEHDATSRIAWLAKNAAQVAAEQRKAEKAEGDGIRKLSPQVILRWIREQTPEYRARLARDITAIDIREARGVLG